MLDLLHLHPTPIPQTARILPQRRSPNRRIRTPIQDNSLEHPRLPQCIQGFVCTPHRLAIRYCPARRRPREPLFVGSPLPPLPPTYAPIYLIWTVLCRAGQG